MKIFNDMCNIFKSENNFIETKNAYFETHECNGIMTKVPMNYKVENEQSGDEIVFGKCNTCDKVFYHID